jgi:hypothetical protein
MPKSTRMMRVAGLAVLFAAVFCLGACANYQLGTGGKLKFSRIFIAPVTSEALIPQAQALVTTALREAFLKDGRVALAESPGDADATLKVTLSSYQRDVTVSQTQDTGLARRFDVTLRAKVTLTDLRSKQTLFENRVLTARRGVFTDSGQQQSEYQTLPLLAEKLAQDAVHAALDVW